MAAASICRRVFDSALPSGAIWNIQPGGDLDKFYAGTADNFERMRRKAAAIQFVRDAKSTSLLSDLEIEFGVIPDTALTVAARRTYLAALKAERSCLPAWKVLENKLRAAGFDVRVYPNEPPFDPETIISGYAPDAYYLVNGQVLDFQGRDFIDTVNEETGAEPVPDRGTTVCEDTGLEDIPDRGSTIESFSAIIRNLYEYKSPTRYRWPFIFWIAGDKEVKQRFLDWNMEWATLSGWTAGGDANLSKVLTWKHSGIRSLEVMATMGWADPIGPYSEGTLPAIELNAASVRVWCSASAGVKAGLVVCDKDGVWDTAGIRLSATGSTGQQLTYMAANGVSAARLYVTTGTHVPVLGDYARFDEILLDDPAFTLASISEQWRSKFEKLVLRYKPLRTWAGLLIDWTAAPIPGGFGEDD